MTELADRYAAFLNAIERQESVPDRILTLCRARIQQIHGIVPEDLPTEDAVHLANRAMQQFSEAEQAALQVAELMPHQHHAVQDDDVERLRDLFGNTGCVTLLTALAFYDVNARLSRSNPLAGS